MPSGGELLASIPGVLLLVVIYLAVSRGRKTAEHGMDATFERLGLRPGGEVLRPRHGPAGREHVWDYLALPKSYVGVYRGHRAGYAQGASALTRFTEETGGELRSTFWSGCEFWVELGFDGPPFMVVEKSELRAAELAAHCPMTERVPTGDGAFDARFFVFCGDSTFSSSVLDAALRQRLLAFPYVLLLQSHERCFFSLFNAGAYRTALSYDGRSFLQRMRRAPAPLYTRAENFLDASMEVVRRIREVKELRSAR